MWENIKLQSEVDALHLALYSLYRKHNGKCIEPHHEACGGVCVELDQVPTTDLCGVKSGGCSNVPVNACVECNPDSPNPQDVESATRMGYYVGVYYKDDLDTDGMHIHALYNYRRICMPVES